MYKRELLFSKLGSFANKTLVESTRLCRVYRHEYVELEHWLKVLLDREDSDIFQLLDRYDVDISGLNIRLERIIHTMPNVSSVVNDISTRLETAVERGLIISQIQNASSSIRTGHILLGILTDNEFRRWLYRLDSEFEKVDIQEALDQFDVILQDSVECEKLVHETDSSNTNIDTLREQDSVLEQIAEWCVDVTKEAEDGKIDPVVGREAELRQVIDILSRRRQNNPILVGEAGVGKTALVEALSLKIIKEEVPELLKRARVMSLDLGKLQAGAGVRGEFESRLKKLIEAIQSSEFPILLFCDEVHTLIGAGGQEGTGDAVNLLKPMLARGELRMIGATTWSEYKQFIEPDTALTRRFQSVYIDEPDEQKAIDMIRVVAPYFADYHNVIIRDSAIVSAVKLSRRHLPLRQLPDKAISLLDTACARVASSHDIVPSSVETCQAKLDLLQIELSSLEKEASLGEDVTERKKEVEELISGIEEEIQKLNQKYEKEKELVSKMSSNEDIVDKKNIINELDWLQHNNPLVFPWVDESVISDVLSDWTGIPSDRMIQDDLENSLNLEQNMNDSIFGQSEAIHEIADKVKIAISGAQPNDGPLGVFLLTGPSGTGKTETALVLADIMYGGRHNLITFNMTEFQESHSVSVLKGAPPGYVGYGKGGKLTEAVRQRPYSVILLDEFDKAHPDVHEIFYQVFDKGWMKDGEGRIISFKQCYIFLTSNIGSEEIEEVLGEDTGITINKLKTLIHDKLVKKFSLALLARMDVIPYRTLNEESLLAIANVNLMRLKNHFEKELKIEFEFDPSVCSWVVEKVINHPNSGRAIKSLLEKTILPPISERLLLSKKNNEKIKKIILSLDSQGKMVLDFE
ncbi:type VI secretion system ATPase TssH [Neisseriaceae bacterium PsAf]|nr:type VI secretion system ATPase TssH [Neisseriaceae bacterium PsAf]